MTTLAEYQESEDEFAASQQVLRDTMYLGCKALGQMLDCIGDANADDHTVAKILVENEQVLVNFLALIREREELDDK